MFIGLGSFYLFLSKFWNIKFFQQVTHSILILYVYGDKVVLISFDYLLNVCCIYHFVDFSVSFLMSFTVPCFLFLWYILADVSQIYFKCQRTNYSLCLSFLLHILYFVRLSSYVYHFFFSYFLWALVLVACLSVNVDV